MEKCKYNWQFKVCTATIKINAKSNSSKKKKKKPDRLIGGRYIINTRNIQEKRAITYIAYAGKVNDIFYSVKFN